MQLLLNCVIMPEGKADSLRPSVVLRERVCVHVTSVSSHTLHHNPAAHITTSHSNISFNLVEALSQSVAVS